MTQAEAQAKFLPLIQGCGQQYSKKGEVIARLATPGEHIITMTKDGKETENTAKEGDFVVRNSTRAQEEYILTPDKIAKRYTPAGPGPDGWQRYKATGTVRGIQYNGEPTSFMASWGEMMALKPGDMIVTPDGSEIYRIARQEFEETYA